MKQSTLVLALFALPLACASASPEPSPTPAEATAEPPVATAPIAATAAATTKELTPEEKKKAEDEKKKAEDAKQLIVDRAEMEADAKAELARWTPELRKETKPLAERAYPSLKAALDAALKGKHRTPKHAARDLQRHPLQTLTFYGLKPTMTVLEYGPGEGWWTELLAPTLAARGKLIVTATDHNGPPDQRSTMYGQRLNHFLMKSPELYGKVERVVTDNAKPDLKLTSAVDMVIVSRGMHGWHNNKTTSVWLAEIHEALKEGGILAVEQHRAKLDAIPDDSSKKGYLPEKFVIQQIEIAGFKLAEKSEINANPKDTTDHPEGVWTLPPTLRLKDKDRDKYLAIGESDRMTLRFTKVTPPAAAKPKL